MATHDHATLVRYVSGELPASEKAAVESHLETCGECSEFVSFTRDFKNVLRQAAPSLTEPETPCPDADTLVAFEADELDEKTAQIVRQHTILCEDCLEELNLLRQVREAARIEEADRSSQTRSPSDEEESALETSSNPYEERWHKFITEEFKESELIDLGKNYDEGVSIGPPGVRLVAARPAFSAERWTSALYDLLARGLYEEGGAVEFSRSFEISLGENLYQVNLTVQLDGKLAFDLATLRSVSPVPLSIMLWHSAGSEFGSVQFDETDHLGKVHCVDSWGGSGLRLLTLTLEEQEKWIPFLVPKDVFLVFENDLIARIIAASSRSEVGVRLRQIETTIESLKRKLQLEIKEPSSGPLKDKGK